MQRGSCRSPRRGSSRARGRGGSERGVGDHRTEHEPRAESGQEQQRVLAEPAEAGPVGGGPVDQGVVVTDHRSPPPELPQGVGDGGEAPAEGPGSGRGGHSGPPARPGGRGCGAGRFIGTFVAVAPGPDHQGPGSGKDPAGIGRTFGVPVGELHIGVEATASALEEVTPRGFEDGGGGDAHLRESGTDSQIDEGGPQVLGVGLIGSRHRIGRSGQVGRCDSGHTPWSHDRLPRSSPGWGRCQTGPIATLPVDRQPA